MDRVGFGVIFHGLSEEQLSDLAGLIEGLRRRQAAEAQAGASYD